MEIWEELEILQRLKDNRDWAYLKGELLRIQKSYEFHKDSSIIQGDSVKAARMLGIIQGLNVAINSPQELIKMKMKPNLMQKAKAAMSEAIETVHTMLKKAFDDFPAVREKKK